MALVIILWAIEQVDKIAAPKNSRTFEIAYAKIAYSKIAFRTK